MWSRNGTPVLTAASPRPSSFRATLIWVSRVLRSTAATRLGELFAAALVRAIPSERDLTRFSIGCLVSPPRLPPIQLKLALLEPYLDRASVTLETFHPR